MGWNDSGNGKNPWNNDPNQGAPDLDEVVRNLQKRFSGFLGGGKRDGTGGGSGLGISTVLILALAAWAVFGGLYKIDQAERGVELRFGKYKRTTMPGLHWHIPAPIESVEKVNVGNTFEYKYTNEMLTTSSAITK